MLKPSHELFSHQGRTTAWVITILIYAEPEELQSDSNITTSLPFLRRLSWSLKLNQPQRSPGLSFFFFLLIIFRILVLKVPNLPNAIERKYV